MDGRLVISNNRTELSIKSFVFAFFKFKSRCSTFDAYVTKSIVTELLKKETVLLTSCYSEKKGNPYDCIVVLDDTGRNYVNFKAEFMSRIK